MADSETKRSPHLQSLLREKARHEPETEEAILREARLAIPTPMLKLVMKDGSSESFAYSYLSRVSFDPGGRLLLRFGDDVAVIEGRNLADIEEKVHRHKASEIHEGLPAEEALKPETAMHVDRIYISSMREESKAYDTGNRKSIN